MSLVNCPECGNRISDKAKACPKCGCPNILHEKPEEKDKMSNLKKTELRNSNDVEKEDVSVGSAELENKYKNAVTMMNTAKTEKEFLNIIENFRQIQDYKNSSDIIVQCNNRLNEIKNNRKKQSETVVLEEIPVHKKTLDKASDANNTNTDVEKIYIKALELEKSGELDSLYEAVKIFGLIPGYKDSKTRKSDLQTLIYKKRESAIAEYNNRHKYFVLIICMSLIAVGLIVAIIIIVSKQKKENFKRKQELIIEYFNKDFDEFYYTADYSIWRVTDSCELYMCNEDINEIIDNLSNKIIPAVSKMDKTITDIHSKYNDDQDFLNIEHYFHEFVNNYKNFVLWTIEILKDGSYLDLTDEWNTKYHNLGLSESMKQIRGLVEKYNIIIYYDSEVHGYRAKLNDNIVNSSAQ